MKMEESVAKNGGDRNEEIFPLSELFWKKLLQVKGICYLDL